MSLLDQWKNRQVTEERAEPITKAPKDALIKLSRGQRRLYFLEQLNPNNPAYNSSEIYTFKGNLDLKKLKNGLQQVFADNAILRTSYYLDDGAVYQKIDDSAELLIAQIDLSSVATEDKELRLQEAMAENFRINFDLNKAPLMRVAIFKVDADKTILFMTLHHSITDEWSMKIFRNELAKYYNASTTVLDQKDSPKIQYTDYCYWQDKEEIDPEQLDYWKGKLAGELPVLELPMDYTPIVTTSLNGATHGQEFSSALSSSIIRLAKDLKTTPNVLLLSTFYLLLFRYSGQRDLLIGSPISMRKAKVLEEVMGFFVETIVLRTEINPTFTFEDLVQKVNATNLEALSNSDVPFDVLVKELNPDRLAGNNPFFRVMFVYLDANENDTFSEDVSVTHSPYSKGVSKFDLTLFVTNENGILSSEFEYSTDLFAKETILNLQAHYNTLLEGIIASPKEVITAVPMLSANEREIFLSKQPQLKRPYAKYASIQHIIEDVSVRKPDAIAVVFKSKSLTYKELSMASDLVAQHVLAISKGENAIVGLCVERSLTMLIGILGILKAGCAYLPIDMSYPSERIEYMIQDSQVSLVLTQRSHTEIFEDIKVPVDIMEDILKTTVNTSIALPKETVNRLAYVIYTSGTTGKPKGVGITQANILNSTEGRLLFYAENPTAFLLMSSISFDSSKAGIFWTLCTGGTLVISEDRLEQDVKELGNLIERHKISHTLMLPSLYRMILELVDASQLQSLNTVIVAGEPCLPSTATKHFEKLSEVKLYNEYGPTEATVWCIAHQLSEENTEGVVPIGKAVANSEIFLLNESMGFVPMGAVGEIYIGGPGLSGSYINNQDLTTKAYIDHSFEKNAPTKRLYKTGDLGRYNKNGDIEFLGRVDQQIKIRGYRVELSEIENIILEDSMVDRAIVLVENTSQKTSKNAGSDSDFEEISYYIDSYLSNEQADEIISAITAMTQDEKRFLINQM